MVRRRLSAVASATAGRGVLSEAALRLMVRGLLSEMPAAEVAAVAIDPEAPVALLEPKRLQALLLARPAEAAEAQVLQAAPVGAEAAELSASMLRNAVKNRWLTLHKASLKEAVLHRTVGDMTASELQRRWRSVGCERFKEIDENSRVYQELLGHVRLAKEMGGSRKRLCAGAFVPRAAGEDALDARTPMGLLPSLPSRRGTGRISMETLGRAVVSKLTHDGCRAPEVKDFICASARSAGWSVRRARSTLAGLNLARRRWSKASGRTGGRPKGWRRVSDEELFAAVAILHVGVRLEPEAWAAAHGALGFKVFGGA